VCLELKGELKMELKRSPSFERARALIPHGYRVKSRPATAGMRRVDLVWTKEGDPPTPFKKRYTFTMTEEEYLTLRKVYEQLAPALGVKPRRRLRNNEEKGNNLEKEVDISEPSLEERIDALERTLSLIMDKLDRLSNVGGQSEKEEEPKELEIDVKDTRIQEIMDELTELKAVDYARIGRRIVVNPHIALYYAVAKSYLDYEGTIEQFITECVINYFEHYGCGIAFIRWKKR